MVRHIVSFVDSLGQDARFALRQSLRRPGFSLLVVVALAIGIGANVAIFSVLQGIVLRPLPYDDPERLVAVWETPPDSRWHQPFSSLDYLDVREQSQKLEEIGVLRGRWFNLSGDGEPERVSGAECTASLLQVLGAAPLRGRLFREEEQQEGNERVLILSYGLWQSRFGGQPDVVGRTLSIDGEPHVVVGIMPRSFEFPTPFGGRDDSRIWSPLVLPREDWARGNHSFGAVARLGEGVSLAEAEAELGAIAAGLAEAYPDTNSRVRMWLEPMMERTLGSVRSALLFLFGVVGLVLLIACANVAGILMARGAQRLPELAVRVSIGAARGRLVRQLLTESLLLSVLGGAAGVALAHWGVRALVSLMPSSIPRVGGIGIDMTVLGFAAAVAVATGLLFGLAPALVASRTDLVTVMNGRTGRGGSRARHRFLGTLVVAQLAIGFVLVNASTLLLSSYDEVMTQRMNFDTERTLVAGISPGGPGFEEPRQRRAFWEELLGRVRRLPGVAEAGLTSKLPLRGGSNSSVLVRDEVFDPSMKRELVEFSFVDAGYHEAMGIPLIAGRYLDERDLEAASGAAEDDPPVIELPIVINRALADELWSVEEALGQLVRSNTAEETFRGRVVGIVRDVRQWGAEREPLPEIYFPHTSEVWGPLRGYVVVRGQSDPRPLAAGIRGALHEVAPRVPLARALTMGELVHRVTGRRRFSMLLVVLFAAVALTLIAAGTYGVMAHSVSERTHEIGVRVALGADSTGVAWLFLRRCGRQLAPGLLVGLLGAWAASILMQGMVYGTAALSTPHLALAGAVIVPVALAATLFPILRALRVDPASVLRSE